MKNITLSVEESVLETARLYAAERRTTVNGLVRSFLTSLAQQEDRTARARRRLKELVQRNALEAGPVTWRRDDLHDR